MLTIAIERPEQLARLLALLADPASRHRLLLDLGERQRERLLRRTAAGIDLYGRRFRPYAPAYRQRRQRAGLGSTVDLFVTGAMLGSLTVGLTPTGVAITFADPEQAAKASSNQRDRPFFGLTPADAQALRDHLAARLQA